MQTLSGAQDWYPANYNIFEVEAKKSAGILEGSLVSFNANYFLIFEHSLTYNYSRTRLRYGNV